MLTYYYKDIDKIFNSIEELKHILGNKNMSDNELADIIYENKLTIYAIELSKLRCMKDLEEDKNCLVYSYRTYERLLDLKFGKQEIFDFNKNNKEKEG